MKAQILMVLVAVSLVLASAQLVIAEDDAGAEETPNLISAADTAAVSDEEATLDETEDVSTVGMGMKQLGIWFTFNQEKKAQKELQLAKLQLVRAKIAARNNNTVAMEKALEAHDRIIERVQARMEKISKSNAGGNLTGLDRSIAVHQARIAMLNRILANANLTEEQRANAEARLAHAENTTAKLSDNQIRLLWKLKNLQEGLANKSAEEIIADTAKANRDNARAGDNDSE